MTETVGPAKPKMCYLALHGKSLLTSALQSDSLPGTGLNQVCLVPELLAALYPVFGCSFVCNIPVLAAQQAFFPVPLREVPPSLSEARSESGKGFGEFDLSILRQSFGRTEKPK